MLIGTKNPNQSQAWWQNWRCKVSTKHIQDATSLALMSKREIYEKLINDRLEGEIWNRSTIVVNDQREKQNKGFNLYQQKREIWYKEGDMEWICKDRKFDINDKTMIETILYLFNHSSINDLFNHFQQSLSLALMANQTNQLVRLINLVTTKLVYQIENFLTLYHISLFYWYKLNPLLYFSLHF